MKALLLFCTCLLLLQTVFSQREEFYRTVLKIYPQGFNDTFIALDVESKFYKGKVVVENRNLYSYLRRNRKFNERQYEQFMIRLLLSNGKLPIKGVTLNEYKTYLYVRGTGIMFFTVKKIESVEEIASRGCQAFIEYYFDNANGFPTLRKARGDEETSAIINILFEWQIPSSEADVIGVLGIAKDYKCPSN